MCMSTCRQLIAQVFGVSQSAWHVDSHCCGTCVGVRDDRFLYYTLLYSTLLYSTLLYCTVLYYTILYYTILYYTILYYTILYYNICLSIPISGATNLARHL